MFIGLAPGRRGADITGVPFTRDASGLVFQRSMIKAGFSLENDATVENPRLQNGYVTNLIKCNPQDLRGNNREPNRDEIENCRSYLLSEIKCVNPSVIVTLGRTVTKEMIDIGSAAFSSYHNQPIEIDGRIILPFYHPSYVARGAYKMSKYESEFISIRRLLQ
jgi:DNA polymerase